MADRFDVLLFGPTGVTGREVARHLARRAPEVGRSWAVAGRDAARIETVLAGLPSRPAAVIEADTGDAASIDRMVGSARVVANLVGPYARYGEVVYEACARRGVHELDLTGETDWLVGMIDEYQDIAEAGHARIVPTAGFEALPFDLGMFLAARTAHERSGEAVSSVDVSVAVSSDALLSRPTDAVSGGTFQSGVEALRRGPGRAFTDPYVLDPPGSTARGRYQLRPRRHAGTGAWLAPMVPSPFLNPPVAHRTAALLRLAGDPTFAEDFRYVEGIDAGSMVPGPPPVGASLAAPAVASAMASYQAVFSAVAQAPSFVRRPLADGLIRFGPKAGQGPRPEELDAWSYRLDVRATTVGGATADVVVQAAGHPGYKSTATMVGEAALILAELAADPDARGPFGFLTPATALGLEVLDRLGHAGTTFRVVG
jgi:short subunit dehydrogenase-like uncharacterized protein